MAITGGLRDSLEDHHEDLWQTALLAGAHSVDIVSDEKPLGEPEDGVLVIGEENDDYAKTLMDRGWRCYGKDMVVLSALLGEVDWESDEFLLKGKKRQNRPKKRRRLS